MALARALGLLGLGAAAFGVLTWPLVHGAVAGETRGLLLGAAALASGLLLAAPARWLVRAPVGITVAAAIALQTTYTIVTGGYASPYYAGFVAIVLLAAFFTNLRSSLGVTLVSMAGLFGVFDTDGSFSVTDAAKQQRGSSRSDDSADGAESTTRSGDVAPGRLIETSP